MTMKRKRIHQSASILAFLAGFLWAVIPALDLRAQEKVLNMVSPEGALIRQMVGTWDVRASVWFGTDAKPIVQSAVARRRLVGDALLEEVMTPSPDRTVRRLHVLPFSATTL
jgi:hypothetical protein